MDDRSIYKLFPHIFIILVVLVNVFFIFFIGRIDLAQRMLVISIPVFASSVVVNYIISSGKYEFGIKDLLIEGKEKLNIDFRILVLLFFYLFLLSVFVLYYFDKRPLIYFVIATILYLVLILEIFSEKYKTKLIILQNVLLFLNIIWGVTMRYPLYFGGTDIIAHLTHSELVYLTGRISHLGFTYANFPLYHIFVAQSAFISGQSILFSKNLFIGLAFSLTIILVYKLTKVVFKNETISLLCMVFYSSFSIVINHGMYMVTRTMAFVGFLFLLYIIFRFKDNKNTIRYVSMFSLFTLFILLVHQVSTIQFLLLLFILYAVQYSYKEYFLHLWEYLFFVLVTVSYWLLLAYTFSSHIILNLLLAPIEETTEIVRTGITTFNVIPYLIINIGTSIFIFIFLIGTLCVLYYSNKVKIRMVLLFTLILAIFFIPSPLDVLEATRDIFTFQRVRLFVAPLMSMGMGIGIYLIYNNFSTLLNASRPKLKRTAHSIFIMLLILAFIFLSVSSPGIATDTDFHEHNPSRHFNDGEIATFSFVGESVESTSFIQSDYFVVRYFRLSSINYSDIEGINQPYHRQRPVYNISNLATLADNNYVIYRQGEFYRKDVLRFGISGRFFSYIRTEENQYYLETVLERNKKIYTNGDNHIYK